MTIAVPAGLAGAVRRQACDLLRAAPVTDAYGAALRAALASPGNLLSDAPDLRWPGTVATCCIAAGGRWEQAVPAAAAVDLFMVALDVLDDEEDDEETPLRATLGPARAVNVSTGLLLLAQRGLCAAGLVGGDGEAAPDILLDAGLRACSGQHADLAPIRERLPGLEASLDVTTGKAAPLVAAACRLGALAGGANGHLQDLYARFGGYVGMVAQLTNDLAAIRPWATGKTDIALGRPTLPLTYAALLHPDAPARGVDGDTGTDPWADGPIQLTWAVAATYRHHALGLIPHLTGDPTSRTDLAALVKLDLAAGTAAGTAARAAEE